ncbi:succinylglutamate desuccinylase/aspartoacylase family protein [Limibacter armeniacum]|uniref:succinylglutamate desuccinylase/aspartoacylase family protein n=1 Tax=Limibacter armeniacum TaxID=466084 RepID=UPI002FE5D656
MRDIFIAGEHIAPGEKKKLNLQIARLPTGTLIDIPVFVNRAEQDGPTLLLMAGMHGDEVNGVEIMRRMMARGYTIPMKGTIVCIPILNVYGYLIFSRQTPDGKDVNRMFPGSNHGSLGSKVAYTLMHEVIPMIDYGVDFHTGGAERSNYPQVRGNFKDPISLELAEAFAAPFMVNSGYRPKSLRKEAFNKGKRILVYEAGESLRFDADAIEEGISGARRVMKYLGIIPDAMDPIYKPRKIIKSSWVRARAAGLYNNIVNNGSYVARNEVLGVVSDPFGEYEKTVRAPHAGYVIAVNYNPVVNRGEALVHLGTEG